MLGSAFGGVQQEYQQSTRGLQTPDPDGALITGFFFPGICQEVSGRTPCKGVDCACNRQFVDSGAIHRRSNPDEGVLSSCCEVLAVVRVGQGARRI